MRIADGRNYYFEYRREQPTALKDQDVPADRTVVGVDCVSGVEPADRRNILRIRDDTDLDKAEFQAGDDYEERDTSSAAYPNDFLMEVVATAGGVRPDPHHLRRRQARPADPAVGAEHELEEPGPAR